MSEEHPHHERLDSSPENQHEQLETHENLAEEHNKHERLNETAEQEVLHAEAAKEAVERQHPEESAKLLSKLETDDNDKPALHPPNKEERTHALKTALSEIRSNLSGSGKAFSKFIHQPKVNAISEFGGKTIVRPTAILFGGLFMFAGSAFYLYLTYNTDSKYNFFVALFLFAGGFIAGLIVELFYRLFFKRSS